MVQGPHCQLMLKRRHSAQGFQPQHLFPCSVDSPTLSLAMPTLNFILKAKPTSQLACASTKLYFQIWACEDPFGYSERTWACGAPEQSQDTVSCRRDKGTCCSHHITLPPSSGQPWGRRSIFIAVGMCLVQHIWVLVLVGPLNNAELLWW